MALNCRNLSALQISLPAHTDACCRLTHTRTPARPVTLKTPAMVSLSSSRSHPCDRRTAQTPHEFAAISPCYGFWSPGEKEGIHFWRGLVWIFCPIGLCGRCCLNLPLRPSDDESERRYLIRRSQLIRPCRRPRPLFDWLGLRSSPSAFKGSS